MNLRDVTYVLKVAELKHFGKAAEQCFVSQPTLSGQIKKLEQELGVKLFERNNRFVELTNVGKEVVQHCRLMLEQAAAIKQVAQSYQEPMAGSLKLGVIPTVSPYLMPRVITPLKQRYPQNTLVLSEEFTGVLLQRLRHHEIDAAIIATEVDSNEFYSIPLFKEPFWLAYPRNHSISKVKSIEVCHLIDANLLLLAEGHCLAQQAMDLCRYSREGQGDMTDLRASSLETLLQMVAAGYGLTLIPALARTGYWAKNANITICQLELNKAYRNVVIVYRKSYPQVSALNNLAELIKANLPEDVEVLYKEENQ